MLRFYELCDTGYGYSHSPQQHILVPRSRYMRDLMTNVYDPYGVVDTVVNRSFADWFWKRRRHLLVLDVDGLAELASVKHLLKIPNILHVVIESSPGKFWVVTDIVGTFSEICHWLRLPGVDSKWASMCGSHCALFIRAVILPNKTPKFPNEFPVGFKPEAKQWVTELRELYESAELRLAAESSRMATALKDNNLESVIADPSFQV